MMYSLYGQSLGLSPVAFWGIGILAGLLFIVVFVLKGYALWHAARRSEPWWFIALLILNTMGILELIYLIFVVKKWSHASSTTPTV